MMGGGVDPCGRPPSLVGWAILVLPQDAGDHKGPLHVHSATLAPTDQTASHLVSLLRLMPILADKSAVGAVNRPLLLFMGLTIRPPRASPCYSRRCQRGRYRS